jgi:hypothetical protein
VNSWWSTWASWPVNAGLGTVVPPAVYMVMLTDGNGNYVALAGVYSTRERAEEAQLRYPIPLTEITPALTLDADLWVQVRGEVKLLGTQED